MAWNFSNEKKITSIKTIDIVGTFFARNGIQEQNVSDNGKQFTKLTNLFLKNWIKHFKSAPYYPAANEFADMFVLTFKTSMKSMKNQKMSLTKKIANFLLLYRNALRSIRNKNYFMGEIFWHA